MVMIPQPQKIIIEENPNKFYIPYDGKIVLDASCGTEHFEDAMLLQREMERSIGFELAIAANTCGVADCADSGEKGCQKAVVRLRVDETLSGDAYRMDINTQGVEIAGGKGADETFDLGKGKSAGRAEEAGAASAVRRSCTGWERSCSDTPICSEDKLGKMPAEADAGYKE